MPSTRFPHLHAILTGDPTPSDKLKEEWSQTKQAVEQASHQHGKVVPLRSKLKTLTHLRLVEGA